MRKSLEGGAALAALVALAAFGASTVRSHHGASPVPAEVAVAPSVVSSASAAPVVLADAGPAPGSDLPLLEVKPRDYHVVPEDGPAPAVPAVTLRNRDGTLIERTAASTAVAAPAAIRPPPSSAVIGGAALATGGAGLSVEGRPVRLFGVSVLQPRDRCAAADGSAHPCDELAQAALAAHLAANATVSCRMPPGQRGDPGFVCHNAAGVDLAAMLVADGLAHADPKSSFDYVGAETAARAARRGLWHVR